VSGRDPVAAPESTVAATVILIAKEPVPGRVKTRLCPPCSPEQAAAVAEAALRDTVDAIESFGARRVVVALDGSPGPWIPTRFEVVPQVDGGLGDRLAAAFAHVSRDPGSTGATPVAVVGMDTPQLLPEHLQQVFGHLMDAEVDSVLGPALDGGYWTIGFSAQVLHEHAGGPRPDGGGGLFDGVPMSTDRTAEAQRRRLEELDLTRAEVQVLRDIDTWDDALVIAREQPHLRTSRVVLECTHDRSDRSAGSR